MINTCLMHTPKLSILDELQVGVRHARWKLRNVDLAFVPLHFPDSLHVVRHFAKLNAIIFVPKPHVFSGVHYVEPPEWVCVSAQVAMRSVSGNVSGNVSGRWVMLADIETRDRYKSSQQKKTSNFFKLWKLLAVRIPACRNAISHERMHPIYTEVLFAAKNFDVLQSRNVIHIYCSSSSMLLLAYGHLVAHMYRERQKHDQEFKTSKGTKSSQNRKYAIMRHKLDVSVKLIEVGKERSSLLCCERFF